jgi:hypothetical protein
MYERWVSTSQTVLGAVVEDPMFEWLGQGPQPCEGLR